jgi:hypothetical protein
MNKLLLNTKSKSLVISSYDQARIQRVSAISAHIGAKNQPSVPALRLLKAA